MLALTSNTPLYKWGIGTDSLPPDKYPVVNWVFGLLLALPNYAPSCPCSLFNLRCWVYFFIKIVLPQSHASEDLSQNPASAFGTFYKKYSEISLYSRHHVSFTPPQGPAFCSKRRDFIDKGVHSQTQK